MERKSLAGLCFILLILIASRVHAEEYLVQAEDAEEDLVQADAEEYLVQPEARPVCPVPHGSCINPRSCDRRCKLAGFPSGFCLGRRCCCRRRRYST